jgi:integrase
MTSRSSRSSALASIRQRSHNTISRGKSHPPYQSDASASVFSTQTYWSAERSPSELKIIQAQSGHVHATTTTIYSHVSDDFMTTTLNDALMDGAPDDLWKAETRR